MQYDDDNEVGLSVGFLGLKKLFEAKLAFSIQK